eukprot:g2698.t1
MHSPRPTSPLHPVPPTSYNDIIIDPMSTTSPSNSNPALVSQDTALISPTNSLKESSPKNSPLSSPERKLATALSSPEQEPKYKTDLECLENFVEAKKEVFSEKEENAVTSLMKVLQREVKEKGFLSADQIAKIFYLLGRMAYHCGSNVCDALVSANVFLPLLHILNCYKQYEVNVILTAADSLTNIIFGNNERREAAFQRGAISAFLPLLSSNPNVEDAKLLQGPVTDWGRVNTKSAYALSELIRDSMTRSEALVNLGGLVPIIEQLRDGKGVKCAEHCAWLLQNLSWKSKHRASCIVEAGAIPELIKLLTLTGVSLKKLLTKKDNDKNIENSVMNSNDTFYELRLASLSALEHIVYYTSLFNAKKIASSGCISASIFLLYCDQPGMQEQVITFLRVMGGRVDETHMIALSQGIAPRLWHSERAFQFDLIEKYNNQNERETFFELESETVQLIHSLRRHTTAAKSMLRSSGTSTVLKHHLLLGLIYLWLPFPFDKLKIEKLKKMENSKMKLQKEERKVETIEIEKKWKELEKEDQDRKSSSWEKLQDLLALPADANVFHQSWNLPCNRIVTDIMTGSTLPLLESMLNPSTNFKVSSANDVEVITLLKESVAATADALSSIRVMYEYWKTGIFDKNNNKLDKEKLLTFPTRLRILIEARRRKNDNRQNSDVEWRKKLLQAAIESFQSESQDKKESRKCKIVQVSLSKPLSLRVTTEESSCSWCTPTNVNEFKELVSSFHLEKIESMIFSAVQFAINTKNFSFIARSHIPFVPELRSEWYAISRGYILNVASSIEEFKGEE